MQARGNQPDPFAGGAAWIWSAEGVARPRPDDTPFRVRYFRRTFEAPEGSALTVHVSADSRYKLWCNGAGVSRGPAKGDVAHHFYDTVDLGEHLRAGRNVLAAQVEYYGDIWCNYRIGGASVSQMTACPGFVLSGVLRARDGAEIDSLHTDRRWRVLIDRAYRHQLEAEYAHCVGMLEDLAASEYPWGFTEAAFDDSTWPAACEVTEALSLQADRDNYVPHRLVGRMIAPLAESAPRGFHAAFRSPTGEDLSAFSAMLAGDGTVTVPARTGAVVLLDAGEITTGYPRIRLSGGAGGAVKLRYAEALAGPDEVKARRDDLSFGDVRGHCDIVRPDGPERTYEPFCWRTFRFVRVEVSPADEPLTIHSLDYTFTAYPFEALARVETSDPATADIWRLCWRTARLCAHETYEDCPYYEQLQYAGDTQVQAMVSYVVAGDASLARQFLYHFDWSRQPTGLTRSRYPSRVPQTIPFWSLHWVLSVRDYWQHTGDRRTVESLWPGVMAVMDYFDRHLTSEGIVGGLDGWLVADWCTRWTAEKAGNGVPPGCPEGRGAFASLMTVATLTAAAELAEALGAESAELRRRAGALRAAAHRVFYDPQQGLYRDEPASAGGSAYTNVWAILAEMPCDRPALAERIVRDQTLCELTAFSTYFAWRALADAGRYDLMGELLAPWRQMLAWGLTTCPETPDFARTRSDCHAWACGPLVEYVREILGVRPAEPGYAVIGIEPKPAGLAFARGRVPLTRLDGREAERYVHVDWRIEAGRFRLDGQVPEGIPCRVRLPDGSAGDFPAGGNISMHGRAT